MTKRLLLPCLIFLLFAAKSYAQTATYQASITSFNSGQIVNGKWDGGDVWYEYTLVSQPGGSVTFPTSFRVYFRVADIIPTDAVGAGTDFFYTDVREENWTSFGLGRVITFTQDYTNAQGRTFTLLKNNSIPTNIGWPNPGARVFRAIGTATTSTSAGTYIQPTSFNNSTETWSPSNANFVPSQQARFTYLNNTLPANFSPNSLNWTLYNNSSGAEVISSQVRDAMTTIGFDGVAGGTANIDKKTVNALTTPSILAQNLLAATAASSVTNPGGHAMTLYLGNTIDVTYTDPCASFNISPSSSSICPGGSTTLTASGASSYLWSNGATTPSITVSPATTTTYTANGYIPTGADEQFLHPGNVIPFNAANAYYINANSGGLGAISQLFNNALENSNSTTMCHAVRITPGQTYGFGYNFGQPILITSVQLWGRGDAFGPNRINNGVVRIWNGSTLVYTSPPVTNASTINVEVAAPNVVGDKLEYVYLNGINTGQASNDYAFNANEMYIVGKLLNTCTTSATVTVNPIPAVPTTSPVTYCQNASPTFLSATVPSGSTAQWYGTNATGGTASTITPTPSTATAGTVTYYVSSKDNSTGCESARVPLVVTVNALPASPVASVTNPTCSVATGSITITSPTGAGLTYSLDGTNFQSGTTFPNIAPGNYTITVQNALGCINTSTTTILAAPVTPPAPTVTVSSPTCTVAGVATISNYSSAYSYTFTPTGPTVSGTGVVSGATFNTPYTVTAQNTTTGCTSVASNSFTILPATLPATPIVVVTPATCTAAGTATVTNYNPSYIYFFSPNNGAFVTTGGVMGGLTLGVTYQVRAFDNISCYSLYSSNFTVQAQLAAPTATASSNSPVCVGASINLTSSSTGGTSYSWTGPNAFTSTLQNPTIASATTAMSGVYTVTVTSAAGCTATATTSVTVSTAPTATTTSNSPVCVGSSINLTSNGGTSYSWTGPSAFSSTTQNPTIASATATMGGVYTVTVTSAAGCTATATTSVTVQICTVKISGSVFIDNNGITDNTISGSNAIPAGIKAVLYDPTTNTVLGTYPLGVGNTYEFAVQPTGTYKVLITTQTATVGAAIPLLTLPALYRYSGENIGLAGTDGTVDGKSATITQPQVDVSNVNFGIKRFLLLIED